MDTPDTEKPKKKRLRVIHATVYLYPKDIEIARRLGNGNLSDGVRSAIEFAGVSLFGEKPVKH